MISRRVALLLFGGAVVAWPRIVDAQPATGLTIGFLNSQSAETFAHLARAFVEGLREGGYEVGRNLDIEYRWADGDFSRLRALAAELAAANVAVIFTGGGGDAAEAARDATSTTPIVFIGNPLDIVESGLVDSLRHPGGRMTGVGLFTSALDQKRVQLMHELLPLLDTMAVLNPGAGTRRADYNDAAALYGVQLRFYESGASTEEIEASFATIAADGMEALLIGSDPYLYNRRELVIGLAARYRIATIYTQREFVLEGGLISYSTSLPVAYRQGGRYVARVLDGENPGDMPVVQDAVFDLIINQTTAAALGLTMPTGLLLAATEFVE